MRVALHDVARQSSLYGIPAYRRSALTPSATRLVFVAAAVLAVTLILGLGRNLSFNGTSGRTSSCGI